MKSAKKLIDSTTTCLGCVINGFTEADYKTIVILYIYNTLEHVYDWERKCVEKTYLYVVSDFSHMGGWPCDLLLTVFE